MDLARKSEEDILAVANPIMDRLMDASTAIDYEGHTQDVTERAQSVLSKDRFQAICEQYQGARGYFAERAFVALFRRPESVALVWRQTFTKAAGEFVAELVLVQQRSRYLVDHVMVF